MPFSRSWSGTNETSLFEVGKGLKFASDRELSGSGSDMVIGFWLIFPQTTLRDCSYLPLGQPNVK